jgi:HlyD family secretion protein
VRGFNSRAQLDESNSALAKATADVELKRAQWAAAKAGPTAEEREVADAKASLAAATLATIRAKLEKTRVVAPESGAVGMEVAEIDEVVTPGKPVLTFVPDSGLWFAFTIREDELHGLTVGSKVALRTAANATLDARLTELRPLGEFATWRAARAVGDHDLNSFRVRFDPIGEAKGIEPGMTMFLTLP